MYLIMIVVLLGVAPILSILTGLFTPGGPGFFALVGKWFVFWAVGVRLFTAGLRQVLTPYYTARSIFGIQDARAGALVREIGFGNSAIGAIGIASLLLPAWTVPAAAAGGIFYLLAAGGHLLRPGRNGTENIAMLSDFAVAAILAVYLLSVVIGWA